MIKGFAFLFSILIVIAFNAPAGATAIVETGTSYLGEFDTNSVLGTSLRIIEGDSDTITKEATLRFLSTEKSATGNAGASIDLLDAAAILFPDVRGFLPARMRVTADDNGNALAAYMYQALITFTNTSDSLLELVLRSSFIYNTRLDVDNLTNEIARVAWDIQHTATYAGGGTAFVEQDAFSLECGLSNPFACGQEFRAMQFDNTISLDAGQSLNIDVSFSMLYEAIDVPEPSALALFAVGLAGMGCFRRKKK